MFKADQDKHSIKEIYEKNKMLSEQVQPIKGYKPENFELSKYIWKHHVPRKGSSDTVQGELLRQVEKLRYEAQNNGNVNWDDDFIYFCDFLNEHLKTIHPIVTPLTKLLKANGQYAGLQNTDSFPEKYWDVEMIVPVSDDYFDFLADCVSIYYENNPNLIPYKQPNNMHR